MKSKYTTAYIVSFIILICSILIGIAVGSVAVPIADIFPIIIAKTLGLSMAAHIDPMYIDIVYQIRLPRVLLAGLVGASLAIAGAAFQGLLRNPLADPYILGVSSGASVGAVASFFFCCFCMCICRSCFYIIFWFDHPVAWPLYVAGVKSNRSVYYDHPCTLFCPQCGTDDAHGDNYFNRNYFQFFFRCIYFFNHRII